MAQNRVEGLVDRLGLLEEAYGKLRKEADGLREQITVGLQPGMSVCGKEFEALLVEKLTPHLEPERVEALLPRPLWLECVTVSLAKARKHLGEIQLQGCYSRLDSFNRLVLKRLTL
jgi:hypothetical protein